MPSVKATARWIENVRTIVDNSRTHAIVCDLPSPKGGDDKGPTAFELAIMSIADCAATIYADVCKQSNIELSSLEVVAEAEKPPDSPKVTSVKIMVKVSATTRKQLLEAAWRRTEANCPVLSIFQDAIPLETHLETSSP